MKQTFRVAHMKYQCPYKCGTELHQGDSFGIMGSTGQSTAEHVHADNVQEWIDYLYHLSDMGPEGHLIPRPDQLLYFIEDNGLFGTNPIITTNYCDLDYWKTYHKQHYGLDIVPKEWASSKDWPLHWNRSKVGVILASGYDEKGYGHWVNIGYEA